MGLIKLFRNLKKRTSVEAWEINLLVSVFEKLPAEYDVFKEQIEDGLIAGVLLSDNPTPNYVNFIFDPEVSRKYEKDHERYFCLEKIKVFDSYSNAWLNLQIYVTHGLVCGYSLTNSTNIKPEINQIDVNSFTRRYLDDFELQFMRTFLSKDEIELINPSDFYEIVLEGTKYYHVRDLEDGDFIGMDMDKNVYQITHDPFEVKKLEGDIIRNLSEQ